jgi:diguanylate cyclase (GGDEF)-like protein
MSTVAAIVSSLVLIGWALDIELFKRIFPHLVAMNPTTAVAFILLALALWLSRLETPERRILLIARWCAGLVALVGLLKLSEVIFGWEMGVDQLFFRAKLSIDPTGQPNRMAPNTALNFLLLACALLFLKVKSARLFYLAQALVVVSIFDSLLPIIGYVYGTKLFYGIGSFVPMALHTALIFLLLGIGILSARAGRGLTKTIIDSGMSGVMVRRLLPAVIALPIIIGWLRLEGQRLGLYDNELGVALMVVAHILIFALLIWWNSFLLFRLDIQRKQAEEELHKLSLTDDLTGSRNRRGFLLLAEQELKLARSKRTGLGLWLIYADLDGLKAINDSLGHEVGSQAIIHASAIMRETFRETDIIARLGGDEFAILAVSNDPQGGSFMLRRLEENVGSFNVREHLPYGLSLSTGVVQVEAERVASIEEVLREADQKMYEHKRSKKKEQEVEVNRSLTNQMA